VVPQRSAEQLGQEAARDFAAFYQRRIPPLEAEPGPILVAALDGKGVPMVKAAQARHVVRRAKGEKAQQKKRAVVATVYTQPPCERPEYKRVWASLLKGKASVLSIFD
jgi:hypothetical protein